MLDTDTKNKENRSTRVLNEVTAATKSQLEDGIADCRGVSAGDIAVILWLNRANVSKELNDLYRSGQIIKVQGKPTLYLHRETLSNYSPYSFLPTTVPNGHTIAEYLTKGKPPAEAGVDVPTKLEQVIGVDGSLRQAVDRAMAAVTYPPCGLHTLITGSTGVGKLRFATTVYQQGIDIGRFPLGSEPIVFSCQDYAGSPNLLISQLFGCGKGAVPGTDKSRRGLVEQASGGMLFLDGIHKLPPKVQDLLITLIEKNTFSRMGEASIPRKGNLMIVAATTKSQDAPDIERLFRNFPVVIRLPDLQERTPGEILEHLLLFFSRESASTGVTFRIHRDVLSCLSAAAYHGNIGEMKGVVKITASQAYLEYSIHGKQSQVMEVGLRHIPEQIMQNIYGQSRRPLEIQQLFDELGSDSILFRPGEIPRLPDYIHTPSLEELESELLPNNQTINEEMVDSYIGHCVSCLQSAGSFKNRRLLNNLSHHLDEIVQNILLPYPQYRPIVANSDLLYSLLLRLDSTIRRIQENRPAPYQGGGDMSLGNPHQYQTAQQLAKELERIFAVTLLPEDINFIALYLYLAVKWSSARKVVVLVVLHGEGVGEGVAATICKICGTEAVYGISFSAEESFEHLLARVVESSKAINQGAGVLFFTDMEPLGSLHLHVSKLCGIPCETVSGLNLPMMISLSQKAVKQGYTMQSLLKEIPRWSATAPQQPDDIAGKAVTSSTFIERIIDEILSTSLTFLNPLKAADSLLLALDGVLADLSLEYRDEIAIKFIFHCSHMLERVIKGEPLEHPKLRSFVNTYNMLLLCVEKRLAYSAEVFGIVIPACELAYVAEIFLPYMEGKV